MCDTLSLHDALPISGKKVWGTVSLLSFSGFKGAKNGLILLGLEPFKKRTDAVS
jgi:hypothetical protein